MHQRGELPSEMNWSVWVKESVTSRSLLREAVLDRWGDARCAITCVDRWREAELNSSEHLEAMGNFPLTDLVVEKGQGL